MFASLSPEAVSESVVLLADEWLLQLPLEALKTFAVPQITSISRDFSLQFHYHRVHPAERSGNRYIYEHIEVSSSSCGAFLLNREARAIYLMISGNSSTAHAPIPHPLTTYHFPIYLRYQ